MRKCEGAPPSEPVPNGAFGDDHHLPLGEMYEPEQKNGATRMRRKAREFRTTGTINDIREFKS